MILSTAMARQLLTQQDAIQSLAVMNRERAIHKVPPVTYNWEMQARMEGIDEDFWFSESMGQSYTFHLGASIRRRSYNLYFYRHGTYRYLFHDTVKTTMNSIFNHRAKQRTCFKKALCSRSPPFHWFYSCGGTQRHVQNSRRCSWFFHYYPRFILKSLTSIACILIDREGPNVPTELQGVQMKVFICQGEYKSPILTDFPAND